MANYKKLEIGESVVFTVKEVAVDKAGKWPDYAFTATDGVIYTAPKAAIDRQLERLTLSVIELPGKGISLERAPNKDDAKKSWWNLDLATPGELKPKAPSPREQAGLKPHAESSGPHIPGLDPDDPGPTPPDAPTNPARAPGLLDAAKEAVAEAEASREAIRTAYAELRSKVAASQKATYGAKHETAPWDAASVQAETATIWIAWQNNGLVKSLL